MTKVDLPNVSRKSEKYYNFNRDELFENRIRNSYINSMFFAGLGSMARQNITTYGAPFLVGPDSSVDATATQSRAMQEITQSGGSDSLNKLLLNFYTSSDDLELDVEINRIERTTIKLPVDIEYYVLKTLKHLKLAGVRVEAKGRLTKRFTASRSVFKMKYKGGLKNVDSSFKGLPAVMLRGIFKSNVQYSLFNSKNRNGAYGVKG